MPKITQARALSVFEKSGRNSSHFVWFLSQFDFFETSDGWVFAYQLSQEAALFALEPLVPGKYALDAFVRSLKEFSTEVGASTFLFAGIGEEFAHLTEQAGFQWIRTGKEPWIELANCIPTGTSSRGVRAARNQALRAGVVVEEWSAASIRADETRREALLGLLASWNTKRLVNVAGFLNATDPLAHCEQRRYFVAQEASGKLAGFIVVSPVPARNGAFLEDLILPLGAPRGTGELLTLETMVGLRDSGLKEASLGVISVLTSGCESSGNLPTPVRKVFDWLPRFLRLFYNFEGLETFRKRFKPYRWEGVYLACGKMNSKAEAQDWWVMLWKLLRAHQPQFEFKITWPLQFMGRKIAKYPISIVTAGISLLSIGLINHWGNLPLQVQSDFGFTGSAPVWDWLHRSVVSDFLYFNFAHFLLWASLYLFALVWAERTQPRRFLLPFMVIATVVDDWVNYLLVIKPFQYFQPRLFAHLIEFKDVGPSLVVAALLGLQICQFRKVREFVFAGAAMVLVVVLTANSIHMGALALRLNHFVFLSLGYLSGLFFARLKTWKSHQDARRPPPQGKSVLPSKAQ